MKKEGNIYVKSIIGGKSVYTKLNDIIHCNEEDTKPLVASEKLKLTTNLNTDETKTNESNFRSKVLGTNSTITKKKTNKKSNGIKEGNIEFINAFKNIICQTENQYLNKERCLTELNEFISTTDKNCLENYQTKTNRNNISSFNYNKEVKDVKTKEQENKSIQLLEKNEAETKLKVKEKNVPKNTYKLVLKKLLFSALNYLSLNKISIEDFHESKVIPTRPFSRLSK